MESQQGWGQLDVLGDDFLEVGGEGNAIVEKSFFLDPARQQSLADRTQNPPLPPDGKVHVIEERLSSHLTTR